MLLRFWTTHVAPGREADYLAFAQGRSRAMFLSQPGCLGVLFLRLPDGRHAACSFWRDQAAIDALSGSASYQDTAQALGDSGILTGPVEVSVHEVEGGAVDLRSFAAAAMEAAVDVTGG